MVATKRVLVVDDEDVVCRSYERVLAQQGFAVEKAHNAKEAFERVAEHDYDVMFTDLRMPGADGLQVVRQLRQSHPKLPVVVITGYPSQDTLQEAARLGVTDYLTKPVAPDVLTHAATQALTAPTWTDVAPYLSGMAAVTPMVLPTPPRAPEALPPAPLPLPKAVVETAPAAAPATAPVAAEPGVLGTTVRLAGGLAMSFAYVLFLPLCGIAVILGYGLKALLQKVVLKGA